MNYRFHINSQFDSVLKWLNSVAKYTYHFYNTQLNIKFQLGPTNSSLLLSLKNLYTIHFSMHDTWHNYFILLNLITLTILGGE
jgi:hypothetical protein